MKWKVTRVSTSTETVIVEAPTKTDAYRAAAKVEEWEEDDFETDIIDAEQINSQGSEA